MQTNTVKLMGELHAATPSGGSEPDPAIPHCAVVTDDPVEILRFAADSFDAGVGCAIVTLTEIRGGAFRAMGSQMAVREDASYCGYVSGGCVEAAVAAEAVAAITKKQDRILHLGEGSPFFDIVLPCGGGIVLAIHVLRENASLLQVLASIEGRLHCSLRYNPHHQQLAFDVLTVDKGWKDNCFTCIYRPKSRLLILGRSIELEKTANLASMAGYEVFASDDWRKPLPEVIDSDTAVALLFHDLDHEIPALTAALGGTPFYIGALGSARTHERRSDKLRKLGYTDRDIKRIKAPIGLFGKARNANALALSVLADIAASRPVTDDRALTWR
jgi:xanthine dehydrogenase accessory factor